MPGLSKRAGHCRDIAADLINDGRMARHVLVGNTSGNISPALLTPSLYSSRRIQNEALVTITIVSQNHARETAGETHRVRTAEVRSSANAGQTPNT